MAPQSSFSARSRRVTSAASVRLPRDILRHRPEQLLTTGFIRLLLLPLFCIATRAANLTPRLEMSPLSGLHRRLLKLSGEADVTFVKGSLPTRTMVPNPHVMTGHPGPYSFLAAAAPLLMCFLNPLHYVSGLCFLWGFFCSSLSSFVIGLAN